MCTCARARALDVQRLRKASEQEFALADFASLKSVKSPTAVGRFDPGIDRNVRPTSRLTYFIEGSLDHLRPAGKDEAL